MTTYRGIEVTKETQRLKYDAKTLQRCQTQEIQVTILEKLLIEGIIVVKIGCISDFRKGVLDSLSFCYKYYMTTRQISTATWGR